MDLNTPSASDNSDRVEEERVLETIRGQLATQAFRQVTAMEVSRLCRTQAELLGALLDGWEQTPNDLKGDIQEGAGYLFDVIRRIQSYVDAYPPPPPSPGA